jgi:hypothetical protein
MYLLQHFVAGKRLLTFHLQALKRVIKRLSCKIIVVIATCGSKNVQHKSNDVCGARLPGSGSGSELCRSRQLTYKAAVM